MKIKYASVLAIALCAIASLVQPVKADVSLRQAVEDLITLGIIAPNKAAAARAAIVDVQVNSKLTNISTCGEVTGKTSTFTVGFAVSRGSSNSNATFLIRAVGPGLRQFGVTNALADPVLKIRNSSGQVIYSQDDWNDGMPVDSLRYWESQTGAFPLTKASLDSAIAVTLDEGIYTVSVEGFGTASGIALIEVYEVQPYQQSLINTGKG